MDILYSWKAQYGLHPLGGGPFSLVRDGPALRVNRYGIYEPRDEDTPRNNHYVHDPLTGKRVPSLLHDPTATNVVLHNRDLTDAAWSKTNVTALKDQTGIKGDANAASSIEATAANGTVLQSITLAESQRKQSAFVRRITGSGDVEMTTDGGSTWTAITVTSGWEPVEIPPQTLANPSVGFRIVTSGDKIAVDFVQNETGIVRSSPIETGASAQARPTDQLTRVRDWGLADIQGGATWWFDVVNEGIFADTGTGRRVYMNNDGSAVSPTNGFQVQINTNNSVPFVARGTGESVAIPPATVNSWAIGDRLRFAFRLIKDGSQHRVRIDYRRIRADGTVEAPVIGTASSLFDLFTVEPSGTLESFFSRGNGVDGAHVAALAAGIVQHTDGVPTFTALEEELS